MADSRRALRNFYKLANEAGNETMSELGSELGSDTASQLTMLEEDSEEQLTQLDELDNEGVNVPDFVSKLVFEKNVAGVINTTNQIRRERAALASAQQELVNDNYKRLIHAAEALEYLNLQGDLASIDEIAEPITQLAQFASKLAPQ